MYSVVEDRLGNAIMLFTEYPLPAPAVSYPQPFLNQIYPVGAVLQVKEPFIHFGSLSGQPEIHVGIPTDLIELWRDGGMEWRSESMVSDLASQSTDCRVGHTGRQRRSGSGATMLWSRIMIHS